MKKLFFILIFIMFFCTMAFMSCTNEEKYSQNSNIKLQFSSDTISFDTIFTTIGSVTKQIRVFNNENEPVKLNYVTLGSGSNSYYRLNVDGDTSLMAKDVIIGAKDSIFVFVRVELDVNNQTNPLLIEDSIIFSFNGKTQSVLLMAYGQDAYYHLPTHSIQLGNTIYNYSLANEGENKAGVMVSGNNITWKNDKPHVIIGTCVVDSAYTLMINEGTKLHFANNSNFWVYKQGKVRVVGQINNPIEFTSLRTMDRYANIPGQWGMVWIWAESTGNLFENVIIKNAVCGIMVDSCVNNQHTIELKNTTIENCSKLGLYARGADVYGTNVIIDNTGSYSVALTLGGSYEFIGSTFANYWWYDSKKNDAVLLINDWYEALDGSIQTRNINKMEFHNCIVYGSSFDGEIELDIKASNKDLFVFDHCLLKTDLFVNNNNNIRNCIFNKDPMFEDVSINDLHLQSNSVAISAGNSSYNGIVPYDIYGNYRLDPPSIGAIEYKSN